uniref:Keratin n=1 Tax=Meleagris gallopavo TaxID=9103 RepID=A0A803YSV3_MELGA
MKRRCCGKTMTPHLMTSLGWACNSSVLHSAAMRRGSLQALRHSHSSIKAGPVPRSLTPLSCRLLLCALPGTLHPTAMSCYDLCRPCGPTPLANSCNEPCVRQCQDSQVVIQPSTVVVTPAGTPSSAPSPRTPPSDPPHPLPWAAPSAPREWPSPPAASASEAWAASTAAEPATPAKGLRPHPHTNHLHPARRLTHSGGTSVSPMAQGLTNHDSPFHGMKQRRMEQL